MEHASQDYRRFSGVRSYVLGLAGLAAATITGCQSAPRPLNEWRQRVEEGTFADPAPVVDYNLFGVFSRAQNAPTIDDFTIVCVDNGQEAAPRAIWPPQQDDIHWEFTQSANQDGIAVFNNRLYVVHNPAGQTLEDKRTLVMDMEWQGRSDECDVAMYRPDGTARHESAVVSRAGMQSLFRAAVQASELRTHSMPYRVGRITYDETVRGALQAAPVINQVNEAVNPYEFLRTNPFVWGEHAGVGGIRGWNGETEYWRGSVLSLLADYMMRPVLRAIPNALRALNGGTEYRWDHNQSDFGDVLTRAGIRLFELPDGIVRNVLSIDGQIEDLFDESWARSGRGLPTDMYVGQWVHVLSELAKAAVRINGASGSGSSGGALGDGGGLTDVPDGNPFEGGSAVQ